MNKNFSYLNKLNKRSITVCGIRRYSSTFLLASTMSFSAICYSQDDGSLIQANSQLLTEASMADGNSVTAAIVNDADLTLEKLNINTANANQIAKILKGIGKVKSRAIVDFRNKNGVFKNIDDLILVKGISKKLVERNRQLIEL